MSADHSSKHMRSHMFTTLVQKELKVILLSPKFSATFAVCSLLILLSIVVGIQEYRTAVRQYDTARQLNDQTLRSAASWMGLSSSAYRPPDPLQVFIAGITQDIGRMSDINPNSVVKLRHSSYSDDPIFALFRAVDLSFIIMVVLSLFAILFTYDAINGEREAGTLQLTFANPVPRATYLLAKLVGSWLGLVVPLLIPILIGVLLTLLYDIPFTTEHWWRMAGFGGISLLFFTFFVVLGLCASVLTHRSSVSFLVALVCWVTLVLIIPRLSIMVAGNVKPVLSVAEVEARRDAYAKDRWAQHMQQMEARWQERQKGMAGLSAAEREAYRDDHMSAWMEEDDVRRKQMQKEIDEHSVRLNEGLRNSKADQEAFAFSLSRISPASCYQLATMALAGTGTDLKSRSENAMIEFRDRFNRYVEKKREETGNTGGFRIEFNSDTGLKFTVPRDRGTLDLSDLPLFAMATLPSGAGGVVVDAGILAFSGLVLFGVTFLAFLRYDVR
jgi:ABC-type transport system involved in multi-copper enzyme maturation permease subunit